MGHPRRLVFTPRARLETFLPLPLGQSSCSKSTELKARVLSLRLVASIDLKVPFKSPSPSDWPLFLLEISEACCTIFFPPDPGSEFAEPEPQCLSSSILTDGLARVELPMTMNERSTMLMLRIGCFHAFKYVNAYEDKPEMNFGIPMMDAPGIVAKPWHRVKRCACVYMHVPACLLMLQCCSSTVRVIRVIHVVCPHARVSNRAARARTPRGSMRTV